MLQKRQKGRSSVEYIRMFEVQATVIDKKVNLDSFKSSRKKGKVDYF